MRVALAQEAGCHRSGCSPILEGLKSKLKCGWELARTARSLNISRLLFSSMERWGDTHSTKSTDLGAEMELLEVGLGFRGWLSPGHRTAHSHANKTRPAMGCSQDKPSLGSRRGSGGGSSLLVSASEDCHVPTQPSGWSERLCRKHRFPMTGEDHFYCDS